MACSAPADREPGSEGELYADNQQEEFIDDPAVNEGVEEKGVRGPEVRLDVGDGVGQVKQALTSGWGTTLFFMTRTSPSWDDIGLDQDSESLCALTKFGGKFNDLDDQLRVYREGGRWRLGASASSGYVTGEARCFRHSLLSPAGLTHLTSGNLSAGPFTLSGCDLTTKDAWLGDATTLINGADGWFRGGAEKVRIAQSSSGTLLSRLQVSSCQLQTRGWANSFFYGTPHSATTAKYQGPNGIGTAAQAGEFVGHGEDGRIHRVFMAPASGNMCHFTEISGKFDGGGEYARIYPGTNPNGTEVWILDVKAMHSQGVTARARCYRRLQF